MESVSGGDKLLAICCRNRFPPSATLGISRIPYHATGLSPQDRRSSRQVAVSRVVSARRHVSARLPRAEALPPNNTARDRGYEWHSNQPDMKIRQSVGPPARVVN